MIDISNTSKEQRINYDEILHNHDWIVEKNRNCIISPDTDGLLCALLMSHLFNWSVKGFYDGKVLLVEQGIKPTDTVFLDMEIFRKDVKSMGQHLLMPNSIQLTENWGNFESTSYRQRNEIVEEQVPLSYAITATNRMEYTLISNEQESLFTN